LAEECCHKLRIQKSNFNYRLFCKKKLIRFQENQEEFNTSTIGNLKLESDIQIIKFSDLTKVDLTNNLPNFLPPTTTATTMATTTTTANTYYKPCRVHWVHRLNNGQFIVIYQDTANYRRFSLLDSNCKLILTAQTRYLDNDNGFISASYQHKNLIVLFTYNDDDFDLEIIDALTLLSVKQIKLEFDNSSGVKSICANDEKIICLRNDRKVHIYNWSLKFIEEIGQNESEESPFYFQGAWQIETRNNRYIIDCGDKIKILDSDSGKLLKSINIREETFFFRRINFRINSTNEIIVNFFEENKLLVFDLNGQFINKYSVEGLKKCILMDATKDKYLFLNLNDNEYYQ
jgi:hypothetical protein